MSGMNLRTKIRAPTRYGEPSEESTTATLLESMRRSRAQTSGEMQDPGSPHKSHLFQRKVKAELSRKLIVDFDPTLPPAAFPTVDITKTAGSTKTSMSICEYPAGKLFFLQGPKDDGEDVDQATLNDMENHVASNNELNPVYLRNMKIMAGQAPGDVSDKDAGFDFEDSDLDEPKDASVVLGEKILNPTWDDIVPPMQVEIVENMIKGGMSWKHIRTRLEIPKRCGDKLRASLTTRNQQIRRGNKNLFKMRENQLRALMRIDNSDIKANDVPHQLVLRRFFGEATQASMSDRISDFLLCQAADVLAGRQYLARRSLSRSLAGAWDHSLVVLQKPDDEDSLEPEHFEWKENLTIATELSEDIEILRNGDYPILRTNRDYIQCVPSKGTIYIRDLNLKPGDVQPTVDWSIYFQHCKPNLNGQEQELELRGRNDGLVRLAIGRGGAAQIQWNGEEIKKEDPMMNFESSPWNPPRQLGTPNPECSSDVVPDDTPIKRPINPRMLADKLAALPGKPCEELHVGKEIHRALSLIHPKGSGIGKKRTYSSHKLGIFSAGRAHQSDSHEEIPLKRSIGGCWSMSSIRYLDPAIGQNRYTQQIQEAKYEAQVSKSQAGPNQGIEAERARRDGQEGRIAMASFSPIRGRFPDGMFSKYVDQRVPHSDETLMGDSKLENSGGSPGALEMGAVDDMMNELMVRKDVSVMNPGEMNGDDDSMETIDDPTMVDSEDEMVMI